MAQRPIIPMTEKFVSEFVTPRGPGQVPNVGEAAIDFELPYAQFSVDSNGQEQVQYGETLRLSNQRGKPVLLELTRIASDRLF